jgi:hypothetical protein
LVILVVPLANSIMSAAWQKKAWVPAFAGMSGIEYVPKSAANADSALDLAAPGIGRNISLRAMTDFARRRELPCMKPIALKTLALAGLAATMLASTSAAASPVVVELFQSQGCSSCPPADANLAAIADRPDVIALSFAVTYWDSAAWKDTFAQPKFTARQWDYAHAFHHDDVYTPQLVVDGRRDGVGANPAEFAQLIGSVRGASGGPALTLSASAVTIGGAAPLARPADVWLVRYDPRTLQVPIRAGENGGKTLPHKDIVRELVRIGYWSGAPKTFSLPRSPDAAYRTAILVQSPAGGPILAAIKG